MRADQTDQDSLPPYDVLDGILEAYVEHDRSPAEIVAMGFAPEHVRRVVRLIKVNEYKRRQAAVGIRITPRGFGATGAIRLPRHGTSGKRSARGAVRLGPGARHGVSYVAIIPHRRHRVPPP